jgi:hypothetical protein
MLNTECYNFQFGAQRCGPYRWLRNVNRMELLYIAVLITPEPCELLFTRLLLEQ